MAVSDGNGWVRCRCGQPHWGIHGAAGLVLLCTDLDDRRRAARTGRPPRLLMQLRAGWTHQGGTWGVPGGARDSHEDAVAAALREAQEEAGADPDAVRVLGQVLGLDHGDWSYIYVIAVADPDLTVQVRTAESTELRWVSLGQVDALGLHPELRSAWPLLAASIRHHVPGRASG